MPTSDPEGASADDGVHSPAPPIPTRLAMPAWLERLTPATDRVQVSLGGDGSVRLQTVRQLDGLTIQLHFSDPELQALAGAHMDRLRTALETHFSEPVRLSLPDGLASSSGGSDFGASDPGSRDSGHRTASPLPNGLRAQRSDLSTHTPTRAPLDGRREWVG